MTGRTDPVAEGQKESAADAGGPLYANPREALKAVREDFHYWTGKLTDSSFTLSAAVIGANWAVFNSDAEAILDNPWATASVTVVVLSLVINLLGVKLISEKLRARMEHAEANPKRWSREFADTLGKDVPWPYSQDIIRVSRALREFRTWCPVVGGALFFAALAAKWI